MRYLTLVFLLAAAAPALAESVIASKPLRPREVITEDAVQLQATVVQGAAQSIRDVVGREVKRAVYAGRPVYTSNLIQPALVERNQVVVATFVLNGLTIATEARALERGSAGEIIRAMNLTSRTTIRAEILEDGQLKVLP